MLSFSIEEGSPLHIPYIIQIQEVTWPATYGHILSKEQLDYMFQLQYSPESLQQQMGEFAHQFIIMRDATEKVVGFASFSGPYESYCKLHKLYLLPSTQGKGAGRQLIQAVEQRASKLGAKMLQLNVNRHNNAFDFYKAVGYSVLEEVDIPIGPYWMNDYVMGKEI